jgi:hypothetical protein
MTAAEECKEVNMPLAAARHILLRGRLQLCAGKIHSWHGAGTDSNWATRRFLEDFDSDSVSTLVHETLVVVLVALLFCLRLVVDA